MLRVQITPRRGTLLVSQGRSPPSTAFYSSFRFPTNQVALCCDLLRTPRPPDSPLQRLLAVDKAAFQSRRRQTVATALLGTSDSAIQTAWLVRGSLSPGAARRVLPGGLKLRLGHEAHFPHQSLYLFSLLLQRHRFSTRSFKNEVLLGFTHPLSFPLAKRD